MPAIALRQAERESLWIGYSFRWHTGIRRCSFQVNKNSSNIKHKIYLQQLNLLKQ